MNCLLYIQRAQAVLPANPETADAFTVVLREWTETCPYDFRDELMMTPFRDITMVSWNFLYIKKLFGRMKKKTVIDTNQHGSCALSKASRQSC
jgi:hypothetical protein